MTVLLQYNPKKKTAVIYNKKNNLIKKLYLVSCENNNRKIKNEFEGFNWYLRKLKKLNKSNSILTQKNNNGYSYTAIKGRKYKYTENFFFKKRLLNNVIQHYKSIWPKNRFVPYHGDLTLDNILFHNDRPIFIDWENFKKKEIWGLDLCHFIISLIILPAISKREKKIDKNNLKFFSQTWKKNFKKKSYSLKKIIEYLKKVKLKENNFLQKVSKKMQNQIIDSII